ncbi:MAG: methylated-DNA--[protein]-cysteine S-methyltransferase [Flavisolibacter sp.]|jgi:methylated-DNA-[protein]-cysteine S-methyltransferase|nr:methylated-DNA--[protein]-cysteine S-methyltransferase [Flavisolibacter sp.]
MSLYASIIPSPLGPVSVRCTDTAIQEIRFLEEGALIKIEKHPLLDACTTQLQAYFEGKLKNFDLPVAQTGTDFQQKVWALLLKVPYGKTQTYLHLSNTYGDVKAIRAVAAANGKNNIAIVIPCHRIIGSNGSLTGYAGGLYRKKWLLEHEIKTKQTLLHF